MKHTISIDIDRVNRSDMARHTATDVAHISRILTGKRTPSPELAQLMADYLHVSLSDLHELLHIRPVTSTTYQRTT